LIKIGFTGTQRGMSTTQIGYLINLFEPMRGQEVEVHHGDCVGADSQFHHAAKVFGFKTIIHPCTIEHKRAYNEGDVILEPKDPLERNHDIVDQVDFLIATPKERTEVLRSGTWATIRYAQKMKKEVRIIIP